MISGLSMPLFIVFLSDLYDSFDPNSGEDTYGKFSELKDGGVTLYTN